MLFHLLTNLEIQIYQIESEFTGSYSRNIVSIPVGTANSAVGLKFVITS